VFSIDSEAPAGALHVGNLKFPTCVRQLAALFGAL
jgi:hypothetical protein